MLAPPGGELPPLTAPSMSRASASSGRIPRRLRPPERRNYVTTDPFVGLLRSRLRILTLLHHRQHHIGDDRRPAHCANPREQPVPGINDVDRVAPATDHP